MPMLVVATFAAFANYAVLLPVVSAWAAHGGAGADGAGLTTTAFMVTTVLTQAAVPAVGRRVGYRATFALGTVVMVLPTLGYAVSAAITPLVVLSALRGIGFGLLSVSGSALVAELAPPSRRGRASGLYGLGVALPNVLLVPVAVATVDTLGYPALFVTVTVVPLVLAAAILALPRVPAATADPVEPRVPVARAAVPAVETDRRPATQFDLGTASHTEPASVPGTGPVTGPGSVPGLGSLTGTDSVTGTAFGMGNRLEPDRGVGTGAGPGAGQGLGTGFGTDNRLGTDRGVGVDRGAGTDLGLGSERGSGTGVVGGTGHEVGRSHGVETGSGGEPGHDMGRSRGAGTGFGSGTGHDTGRSRDVETGSGGDPGHDMGRSRGAGTGVVGGTAHAVGRSRGVGTELGAVVGREVVVGPPAGCELLPDTAAPGVAVDSGVGGSGVPADATVPDAATPDAGAARAGAAGSGVRASAGTVRARGGIVRYVGPVAVMLPVAVAATGIITFAPLALPGSAPTALLVFGAAALAARWAAGHLADRYPSMRALLPVAVITAALGLGTLALAAHQSGSAVLAVPGSFLLGVGFGTAQNQTLVVLFRRAGTGRHGTASAVWNMALDAGTGVGGVLLGALAGHASYPYAFAITAAALALCVPVAVGAARRDTAAT